MRQEIGELLLQEELINTQQLKKAHAIQQERGISLGDALLELGYIDKHQLAKTLAKQLGLPFIDIKSYEFQEEYTLKLSENFARKYQAMVLNKQQDSYLVAMSDPTDIFSYDEIASKLDKPVSLAVVVAEDLLDAINLVYRHREEISGFAEELSDEINSRSLDISTL